MSYATVVTAQADTALTSRVALSLRRRAYTRIDTVANTEDQRERNACIRTFGDSVPTAWTALVLLALDQANNLATATDAQIDTAVNAVWARIGLAS